MCFRELLAAEFSRVGALSEVQLDALERHFSQLVRWNHRMNLTRIEDVVDAVRLHYCESLFLARALPSGKLRIVDVGSGAGFPGFPVAVFCPEFQVDLVESNHRRAVFLRDACHGIGNIRVIAERSQDLDGHYDWIISRAVRPTEVLNLKLAPKAAILMSSRQLELGAIEVLTTPWRPDHIVAMFHVKLD